ncbi:Outer membrane protein (porin) [Burkholderia sp. D7]|nr:Outer membrane protein (porin) [Burkholderia sp. D7]
MKKACVVGFCLAAAGIGTAQAQSSVTLYGVADGGILYKTHAAAGGSAWSLNSGGELTDRWGLIGSEDLGGGLHAVIALESAFRISTGAFINGGQPASAGTVLFDRGATVGLKSDKFGTVLLGKNLSPLLRTLADIDISGYSNFGSLNNLLYQNLSGFTGFQYSWVDNSAEYQLPNIYGLQGAAMYSFGGASGDFQAKRVVSGSLSYRFGDFLVGGAYFSGNDPTGLTNNVVARAYTIGANYHFDRFKFAIDFSNFKNPVKGTSDNFYTGEITYNLTYSWFLVASYIRLADRANSNRDASLYKVGADYSLSKRTALYADVGYVKNNSSGTLGIQNSTPVGVTGKNQLGLLVGIRHYF